MSSMVKYLPPLKELKNELENNPTILEMYSKYDSYVGDSDAVDYLISLLIKEDKKNNKSIFQKAINYITKKI